MGVKDQRGPGSLDAGGHLRRRSTVILVVGCLLLAVLAGLRLEQLGSVAAPSVDTRVIVLEDPRAASLWFEIVRDPDPGPEGDRYRLESASIPVSRPADGALHDQDILTIGPLRFRFERVGARAEEPVIFRWPLEEVSAAGTRRFGGWRRLDIGGDPIGAIGIRDRLYVPWKRVCDALAASLPPAELNALCATPAATVKESGQDQARRVRAPLAPVKAGGRDTADNAATLAATSRTSVRDDADAGRGPAAPRGIAMILPRAGVDILQADTAYRVAAEVPGVRVMKANGATLEVPRVRTTPPPDAALPVLEDGDRLVGPGFALWFAIETAAVSEPILDERREVVGYQPRQMRYLSFREVSTPGAATTLAGGGARLVALEDGPEQLSGEAVGVWSLTGGTRFRFVGRDALLGRFHAGPVPSRLPDHEFLRLARAAFADGTLYTARGMLYVRSSEVLEAVATLRALEGAPPPFAGARTLRAWLEPLARGEGEALEEPAIEAAAALLLGRLGWEPPAESWNLTEARREASIQLLKGLAHTSGSELDAMLEAYNRAVVPQGLWVAGRLVEDGNAGGGGSDRSSVQNPETVPTGGDEKGTGARNGRGTAGSSHEASDALEIGRQEIDISGLERWEAAAELDLNQVAPVAVLDRNQLAPAGALDRNRVAPTEQDGNQMGPVGEQNLNPMAPAGALDRNQIAPAGALERRLSAGAGPPEQTQGLAAHLGRWQPAAAGDGAALLPVMPDPQLPAVGPIPLEGRWRAVPGAWHPDRLPPATVVVQRYRRGLELSSPVSGQAAFAAPGWLEVCIDGVCRRGPGTRPGGGPGLLLPLSLESGPHVLEATVRILIPEARGGAFVSLAQSGGTPLTLVDARGAGWRLPDWEKAGSAESMRRLWRPLVRIDAPRDAADDVVPGNAAAGNVDAKGGQEGARAAAADDYLEAWSHWEDAPLEVAGGWPTPDEDGTGAPDADPGSEAERAARGALRPEDAMGPVPGSHRSALAAERDTAMQVPTIEETPGAGAAPPAHGEAAWTDETPGAGAAQPALGETAWIDEPPHRTAAGGSRYVTFYVDAAVPGPRTLALRTTAVPYAAWWNDAPLDLASWQLRPSSTPYSFVVEAPAGRSSLRIALEQQPSALRRVQDSPLEVRNGCPAGFLPRAVTRSRVAAAPMAARAPIVDRDGRSRPALLVERGSTPLRVDQELMLGEHAGRGDTTILFPDPAATEQPVLELADRLKVLWSPATLSFIPSQAALFFRQEDPLKPPFLPFGSYRVSAGSRDHFRSDRDQIALAGDPADAQRIEYLSSPSFLLRGERVVVGPSGIQALRLDPLPELPDPPDPGGGELLRLVASPEGVTVRYRGAPRGASLFRPGAAPVGLAPGDAPIRLEPDDRIALPRSGAIFRYVERHGILAHDLPEGARSGPRVDRALGLDSLAGAPGEGGAGLEQVFDAALSGQGAPAVRVRLTLDDDLQRYARAQLLRQLELLRQLGPLAVEDEEGDVRVPPGSIPEGALMLMDARTGALLAAVSEPDGHAAGAGTSGDAVRLRTWHDLRAHPGSTFKLVTALAALEQRDPAIVAMSRGALPAGFSLAGGVSLNGATLPAIDPAATPIGLRVGLRNHKRKGVDYGTDIAAGLEKSLNTYFGYLALLMHRPLRERWAEAGVVGDDAWGGLFPIYEVARRVGFGEPFDLVPSYLRSELATYPLWRRPPSIDALGRTVLRGDALAASPSRFPRMPMNASEIASTGIGQGEVYATPLQMALVAAVFATGGIRPSPHIVEGLGALPRGEPPRSLNRVADESSIARVRAGMKAVVATGSAAGAFGDSPLAPWVYGKTGTAERPATGGGSVNDSWFVGYIVPPSTDASSSDPSRHELAFACQIPAAGLGGRHAAEVVDRLLRDVARYYGWHYRRSSETRTAAAP